MLFLTLMNQHNLDQLLFWWIHLNFVVCSMYCIKGGFKPQSKCGWQKLVYPQSKVLHGFPLSANAFIMYSTQLKDEQFILWAGIPIKSV